MKKRYLLSIVWLCTALVNTFAQQPSDSLFTPPPPPPPPLIEIADYQLDMEKDQNGEALVFTAPGQNGMANFTFDGAEDITSLVFEDGKAKHYYETDEKGGLLFIQNQNGKNKQHRIYHLSQSGQEYRVKHIPLWLSILPPLVAILLALVFKEVVVSLFLGIWTGAFIANGMRPGAIIMSIWETVEKYIINALNDGGHLSVIVFSLLIGGMVAIISRNGGMAGVVQSLSKYARSPRSSQFITWLLGVAIFFDDYANTLIVGNTMRSVTDRFKISREKLAYIVDSTAAPVSAIAFITTWIGAELGYIQSGIDQLANFTATTSPYALFISSLKYSFYPVLTLGFILILIWTKRDYGTMLAAETRARTTGRVSSAASPDEDEPNMEDLTPVKGAPLKWYNAFIPVAVVILMTIFGLFSTGMDSLYGEVQAAGGQLTSQSWGEIWANLGLLYPGESPGFFMKIGKLIGAADSYIALLWASSSGVFVAILLTVGGRIMNLFNTMHTMTTGFKTMLPALIILTLAWALAITTQELHTATYLTGVVQDSLSPYAMPSVVFVLSAAIAFSTGSSWSTMAILYPIAMPITWGVCQANGIDPDISLEILLNVIATVLAASVLGDHCSPISDTTILSSLASDCNHIDHVRTQLPYALTVGVVALTSGFLSTYFGGGWGISTLLLLISFAVLYFVVMRFGKTIQDSD